MIQIRDVFQLQFGKAKEAQELWKVGMKLAEKEKYGPIRVMTDLTGPFYTLVLESTHPSLADYEASMKRMSGSNEWSEWYRKFVPLVESGRREIFTVVQ